jgi:predicted nucleic acid-binding protein
MKGKKALIDTSVLIEAERRHFDLAVWGEQMEEVAICDATIAEFLAGEPAKDASKLKRFLEFWETLVSTLPSMKVDRNVCQEAGRMIAAARRHGFTANLGDGLHAAAASLNGWPVATIDTDHFRHLGVACFNPLEQAPHKPLPAAVK